MALSLMSACQAQLAPLSATAYLLQSDGFNQSLNGSSEFIPTQKSPAFVFGEKVIRPIIDASASVLNRIWEATTCFFSPSASAAKNEPPRQLQLRQASLNEITCPVMSTWLGNFTKSVCNNGGDTISPMTSVRPKEGISVSLKGHSQIMSAQDFCLSGKGASITEAYVKNNSVALSSKRRTHEPYLGGWYNSNDKQVYLDVSVVFSEKNKKVAIKFAQRQDQIAAYDIARKEEIPTGGTGKA